jgi:hypothetical protein
MDCLVEALSQQHDPNKWHLFIDSLNLSLKVVLLQNGNKEPSAPIAHAVHMRNYMMTCILV